ncbi:MAG: hypothetical protein EX285_03940 [Thaumarchaeota archaeon]|nr:hypothetical protein [Nitrososphaerota archaeon]
MSKIPKEKTKMEDLIKLLKQFPDTATVRRLRRELSAQGEAAKRIIRKKAKKESQKIKSLEQSQLNRSSKMKRYYRYLKSIQKNYFPDTPLKQLRTMYKRKKQGLDVDVSDIVFTDPSPT